ncbi:MAG: hypothetical protein PHO31_01475 [Candidatus Pacebacteria bacterium]|nr:hypothetical protein [Candidatus Paceibacterota bacterium]
MDIVKQTTKIVLTHGLALSLRNQGKSIKNDWLSHERFGCTSTLNDII